MKQSRQAVAAALAAIFIVLTSGAALAGASHAQPVAVAGTPLLA